MAATSREQLTELLYDAALAPELWPDALRQVADAVGGSGVALLSYEKMAQGLWLRVDPAARAIYDARFVTNPFSLFARSLRQSPAYRGGVFIDESVLSKADYYRTEYFNEFMRPHDGDATLMFDLGVHGVSAALNIGRTPRAGRFSEEDRRLAHDLHADIARAFWLSVKLNASGARDAALVEAMEYADHAVVLLGQSGAIVHANVAATSLLARREGLLAERGHLGAETADDRARLDRAIGSAFVGGDGVRHGRWVSIRRAPPAPPLKLTLTPIGINIPALFEGGVRAMVTVLDAGAPPKISGDLLQAIFGLTPAQARLAAKLAEGLDLRAAASALGIGIATARSHLYETLAKTHAKRQSDLMRLLARL